MWDRPDVLHRVADGMLTLALVLVTGSAVHVVVHSPLFELRHVQLVGAVSQTTREQVAEIVRRDIRGNLVTLDIDAARTAFERLPWARAVMVRRHWPGQLEVTLEEHIALARWGDSALVNTHGEVFNASYAGYLPVFSGPPESVKEIAIQYEYFRSVLAPIARVPTRVSVSARHAWQIQLDGGTVLELGRDQAEARLARLASVYDQTVARLNRPIEYIDLRYSNGFAVRIPEMRDGAPRERRKGRA
jgi:cell division protein FtsQ